MLNRRACLVGVGQALLARRALASAPRRLALLLAAPWQGESFLGDDMALMQDGLRGRGLSAAEVIAVLEPLDRAAVTKRLEEVRRRIAAWRDGELFLYYNGHGMYGPARAGRPEPGLQLDRNREQPGSFLLWRELFELVKAPPGVRLLVLPDCCHTNLLAGRLPANVTALIMKSDPQDALTCRTGTSLFGEAPRRTRHGVISYYAGSTLAAADTVGSWHLAQDQMAARDMSRGQLESFRRVSLMVEGDPSLRVLPA
jgi:hypothetical protein